MSGLKNLIKKGRNGSRPKELLEKCANCGCRRYNKCGCQKKQK